MAHVHPAPTGAALRSEVAAQLDSAGVAWTSLREAVFDSLARSARPLSAYDVADDVSRRLGRRVAANSVYRILDVFVTHRLVKRIESRNAYLVNIHPSCEHDCIFLVCRGCGAVEHVDDDSLAAAMRQRASGLGFRAERPVLELVGLCTACVD